MWQPLAPPCKSQSIWPEMLTAPVSSSILKIRSTWSSSLRMSICLPIFSISVRGQRHLIFATASQLAQLKKAKSWYIDGTFKLCRKPFSQLVSINAFVMSDDHFKQVPLLYVMMSGRSKRDYREVFLSVINLLDSHPAVERITIDFEAALWSVLRRAFPTVKILGCAFHWTQAVWRKIQELGLQVSYMSDDATFKYLRKVMSLPFLPADKIPRAFQRLLQTATGQPIQQLMSYIADTWVYGSVWTPVDWSVYMQSVRTNNDIEGWHHRINRKANGKSQLPFYSLIQLLHSDARLTALHIRLVGEKKLKRNHRRAYRTIQARLFKHWEGTRPVIAAK